MRVENDVLCLSPALSLLQFNLFFLHITNFYLGAFTSGNYGPPSGYCFDTSCHYCRDDPVVDSPVSFHLQFIFVHMLSRHAHNFIHMNE